MSTTTYNQLKQKIERQQAKHDKMFSNPKINSIKKCTRITYARHSQWSGINHSRVYYTHVKL